MLVPEDVAEYEFTPSIDQANFNDDGVNSFKAEAQAAGLSKEQYAFVMKKYEETITNLGFDFASSAAVLQKDWGDSYKENVNSARRAFEEFAPSDISLDDPVLNHPTVVKLLARMGQELGEDSQAGVKGSRAAGVSKEEIHSIMASSDYYNNPEKQAQVAAWYQKNTR